MPQHRYRNRRIFTVERSTEEALERMVRAGLYRNASRAVDAAVALLLAQHVRRGALPPSNVANELLDENVDTKSAGEG
jgi:Arc/MetJ-type ribon-helix-helix transcriptional regulator